MPRARRPTRWRCSWRKRVGEERFRREVKVYATDADTEALVDARHGRYQEKELVAAFGEPRTRRFFDLDAEYGVFRPDLRRSLIFGRHDLVRDPPISKIDRLTCRNTLMYFTSEVQTQVLRSFHFALTPDGYLFLGEAEALTTRLRMFGPVDGRKHIFRRKGQRHAGLLPIPVANWTRPPVAPDRLAVSVVAQSPLAQFVVDGQGNVLLCNPSARRLFAIGTTEVGWPLELSDLSLDNGDLQRLVDQAFRERRIVVAPDVSHAGRTVEPTAFDVVLAPLDDPGGVVNWFHDVSRYRTLGDDLERSQRELASAYGELQSAVEELETTNEELHSTNEELETMNEELQSTIEELDMINNGLRARRAELDDLNTFLQSVLTGLRSAVVVLGTEMPPWSSSHGDGGPGLEPPGRGPLGHAGRRSDGPALLEPGHRLPRRDARARRRTCLAGRSDGVQVVTQPAINRRGRPVEVSVTVNRLMAAETPRGVILLMDAVFDPKRPPAR